MLVEGAAELPIEDAIAELRRVGYARLPRVLAEDARLALGERVDALMHGRVVHDGLFFQHDAQTGRYEDLQYKRGWIGPSSAYRKIEKLEKDPLFLAWMSNPLFERLARAWIEGPISLYRAVLFTKSERGGTVLPWHQDGGAFWGVDRAPTLQIWTALDDVPQESGCVEVLPETHLAGLTSPEGGVVPDALLEAVEAEQRAVPLPAQAGEVLLIHNHLWHRSRINTTGQRRAALSLCFMSAATRCLRKKRAPRQFATIFE